MHPSKSAGTHSGALGINEGMTNTVLVFGALNLKDEVAFSASLRHDRRQILVSTLASLAADRLAPLAKKWERIVLYYLKASLLLKSTFICG